MGNRTPDIVWAPPSSVDEARTTQAKLVLEIQNIQQQLGDKSEWHESRQEYMRWRKGATVALTCKLEELRRVKDFLRERYALNNTRPASAEVVRNFRNAFGALMAYVEHLEGKSCGDDDVQE